MNVDAKIINKIIANQIQQHIKRIAYHDQVGYIQEIPGWFGIRKSMLYITLTEWTKNILRSHLNRYKKGI